MLKKNSWERHKQRYRALRGKFACWKLRIGWGMSCPITVIDFSCLYHFDHLFVHFLSLWSLFWHLSLWSPFCRRFVSLIIFLYAFYLFDHLFVYLITFLTVFSYWTMQQKLKKEKSKYEYVNYYVRGGVRILWKRIDVRRNSSR